MFPIALIWIVFDGFFIGMMATNGFDIPTPLIVFMSIFSCFISRPCGYGYTKPPPQENVTKISNTSSPTGASSSVRALLRSTLIQSTIMTLPLSTCATASSTNRKSRRYLRHRRKKATVIEDLDNPREVSKILQSLVSKVKTNVSFTEGVKVEMVKCKYCGTKTAPPTKTVLLAAHRWTETAHQPRSIATKSQKAGPHQNDAAKDKPTQQKDNSTYKNKTNKPIHEKARRCVLFLCIECLDFRLSCSWFHFAIFRLHTVVFWIAFRRVFGGLTAYFQHNTIFLQTSL